MISCDGWLSPEGSLFGIREARDNGGRTLLWQAKTGRLIVDSREHHSTMALDPTERWMALRNDKIAAIDIFATTDGKLAHRVKLAGLPRRSLDELPRAFQLSPTGDRLSFVHQGVVYLWDAVEDRPATVVEKPGHFGLVRCVAQHPGAQLIASGGTEGVVLLWDRRKGTVVRTLIGHTTEVVALAFHPDGTRLASASSDGTVILWDVSGKMLRTSTVGLKDEATPNPGRGEQPGNRTSRPEPLRVVAKGLVFEPNGSALLVGATEGALLRLDVASGQELARASTGTAGLAALALSADGSSLATASPGGRVTIRDAGLSRVLATWDAGAPIAALAFAGSGEFLVTGGATIELREAATGRVLFRHEPPQPPVKVLSVDDQTGELAYADASSSVQLLSLADLHRAFRDLGLEIPGFPLTSSALLPSKLAEELLGETPAPTGQAKPVKEEGARPGSQEDIPRVRSELEKKGLRP
jgi:WD40 repeat protein